MHGHGSQPAGSLMNLPRQVWWYCCKPWLQILPLESQSRAWAAGASTYPCTGLTLCRWGCPAYQRHISLLAQVLWGCCKPSLQILPQGPRSRAWATGICVSRHSSHALSSGYKYVGGNDHVSLCLHRFSRGAACQRPQFLLPQGPKSRAWAAGISILKHKMDSVPV